MTVFAAILLAVLTFAFVTYPLFKKRFSPIQVAEDEDLRQLQSRRDTTYSMLKELDFDYQSGILTEEDYHDLEARYKKKAISILKDIDDFGKGPGIEEKIEEQVAALRQSKDRFCSQCGAGRQEDDRFCSRCGVRLSQEGSID
jgi:hypothetical protein